MITTIEEFNRYEWVSPAEVQVGRLLVFDLHSQENSDWDWSKGRAPEFVPRQVRVVRLYSFDQYRYAEVEILEGPMKGQTATASTGSFMRLKS